MKDNIDINNAYKAGTVALIGRPNVGKSSIVNLLVGEKVAAVSPTAQTTREAVRGVLTLSGAQIVLVDTPGIHEPHHALGRYMIAQIKEALSNVSCICYVVEACDDHISKIDVRIAKYIAEANKPSFLILNKADLLKGEQALWRAIEVYQKLYKFDEIIPFSALKGINKDVLIDKIMPHLPEGPPLFDEDALTDKTERHLAAEIIREKVFMKTEQEVPHSAAVIIDSFKSPEEYEGRKRIAINATIVVEKDGQKAIIIGHKGERILNIRLEAERELSKIFGHRVNLDLWIKVRQNWRRSQTGIKNMGYE